MQTTPTKSEAEPTPSKPITAKAPAIAPVPVPSGNGAKYSVELLEKARVDTDAVLKELGSQLGGLSEGEADSRLNGSSLFSASGFRLQDAHLQRFGLEFLSCFLVATILPV
jgi:hypothetical protein